MPSNDIGLSPKAIGWALLSQAFWIPLLAIDLHDRWVAQQPEAGPPPPPESQAPPVVGSALGHAVSQAISSVGERLSSVGTQSSSLLDRPLSLSVDTASTASPLQVSPVQVSPSGFPRPQVTTLLGRAFTRAQLLGGSIGLPDLQEGPMAPLALVERALQRSSGDPLAALPSSWREPMRQALLKLAGSAQQLSTARMVTLPSRTLSQPVQVPLALQSDGSVDVLQPPSDPAALRDIETWSRQQSRPAAGSLQPALVLLHPLPAVAPIPLDAVFSSVSESSAPDRASSGSSPAGTVATDSNPSVSASAAPGASASRGAEPPAAVSAVQAPAGSTASQAVTVPLMQETPAPAATAPATIPLPILSEAPAPEVPSAAAVEAPVPSAP